MDNGLWHPVSVQNMSTDRPKRDSMFLEETAISNMWKIAAIVEALECKNLCGKEDSSGSGKTANPSSSPLFRFLKSLSPGEAIGRTRYAASSLSAVPPMLALSFSSRPVRVDRMTSSSSCPSGLDWMQRSKEMPAF